MIQNAGAYVLFFSDVQRAFFRKCAAPLAPMNLFLARKKYTIVMSDVRMMRTAFFFIQNGEDWRKLEGAIPALFSSWSVRR